MNGLLYKGGFKDNLDPEFERLGAEQDTTLELDLFKCPADVGPARGGHCPDWIANSERSSYDHFGNSYAANIFMVAASGPMWSNSPYLRPVSRIPTPTRTLYYEENVGRWAWSARQETCDFISFGIYAGPTKVIKGWHGADWTFARAFVDAHAEMQKIYIEGTQDSEGYARHYRIERVFQDEDDQQFNRCIIVRGDGWAKGHTAGGADRHGLVPDRQRASVRVEDCVAPE